MCRVWGRTWRKEFDYVEQGTVKERGVVETSLERYPGTRS